LTKPPSIRVTDLPEEPPPPPPVSFAEINRPFQYRGALAVFRSLAASSFCLETRLVLCASFDAPIVFGLAWFYSTSFRRSSTSS
jgi:hypothetical protein